MADGFFGGRKIVHSWLRYCCCQNNKSLNFHPIKSLRQMQQLKIAMLCGACCLFAASALAKTLSVLVFSKTGGYRHESITAGQAALVKLAKQADWSVEFTEDSTVFNPTQLARYQVVVFLNTTGNVLNPEQQLAFEGFIRAGGGFVGIHSAADTEYDWPWYGQLVGAYFKSHPDTQPAEVQVLPSGHPITRGLPARWQRTDEWYNYRDPLGNGYTLLATVNEKSYQGGEMPSLHPIMWCHEFEGGRAFYTGMGHTKESFQEKRYLQCLRRAIDWAGRR